MRNAINNNPLVQIGLIAGLGLLVAYMLVTRLGSGSEATEAEPTTPPATEAAAADGTAPPAETAPAPGAEATEAVPGTVPAEPEADAAIAPEGEVAPTGVFEAGPGLPEPVVNAYDGGQTVVLLITRVGGIDDSKLAAHVDRLPGDGVSLFQAKARNVARYSRIVQGVDIDRAPALVVLAPMGVTGDGPPVASVSYGFRGYESVLQAINDAGYEGGRREYYPE